MCRFHNRIQRSGSSLGGVNKTTQIHGCLGKVTINSIPTVTKNTRSEDEILSIKIV